MKQQESGAVRRLAGLVAGALLTANGLLAAMPAPRAAADPVSSCTSTSGVVVVVDFSQWGEGIKRGCDTTPTTGYEALHEAGFTTEGTQHDGPAFICRISGYPTSDEEACVLTPPATAYWSYWHANAGQSTWSYSQLGAMSYKPAAGSVDAWVFGATNTTGSSGGPSFTPDQARAGIGTAQSSSATSQSAASTASATSGSSGSGTTSPTTKSAKKSKRTKTATASPTSESTAASTSATATTSATPSESPTESPAASDSPTPSASTPTESTTPSAGSSAPVITDVEDDPTEPTAASSSTGSPLPLILVGVVVVAVAGGTSWTRWRHRAR
ncbi:hypothetical protein [Nocardioides sp.]|uniref:hypothetical protein n=1 Tax=Nocardioides sp. TaxID=35761 RepID=UPI0039E51F0C